MKNTTGALLQQNLASKKTEECSCVRKLDTPSKGNTPGPLDVTQGSAAACYRDSRYQAYTWNTETERSRKSKIERKAEIDYKRTNQSESCQIRAEIRTDLLWKMTSIPTHAFLHDTFREYFNEARYQQ